MDGDDAVRRIQRIWRRYSVAAEEAQRALAAVSQPNHRTASIASHVAASEQQHARLAAAASRIQNFWRNVSFERNDDDDDDDDDDDEESNSVNMMKDQVRQPCSTSAAGAAPRRCSTPLRRRRRHHRHHPQQRGSGARGTASPLPAAIGGEDKTVGDEHSSEGEDGGDAAALRIQRMWRRYRQAVLDHEEEWSEMGAAAAAAGSSAGEDGDETASQSGHRLSSSASSFSSAHQHQQQQQQHHQQHDQQQAGIARSAAVVEKCWRDLRDECESLATSLDGSDSAAAAVAAAVARSSRRNRRRGGSQQNNTSNNQNDDDDDDDDVMDDIAVLQDLDDLLDGEDGLSGDGEVEQGRTSSCALAIQRWWRSRAAAESSARAAMQYEHDRRQHHSPRQANDDDRGGEPGAAAATSGTRAFTGLSADGITEILTSTTAMNGRHRQAGTEEGGGEDVDDDGTPITPEDAVRALQRRFRWRRLSRVFLDLQARVNERDRREAAETVQRVWRIRKTRLLHREQMRRGLMEASARVIQTAFRQQRTARDSGASEHQQRDPAAGNNNSTLVDKSGSAPAASGVAEAALRRNATRGEAEASRSQTSLPPAASRAEKAAGCTSCVNDGGIRSMPQCVVCMSEDVQVVLLPCSHACLCSDCAACSYVRCPICRAVVAMRIRIYL